MLRNTICLIVRVIFLSLGEMKLTLDKIKNLFLDVIEGNKSFEEASVWASEMMRKDELGELELNSGEDVVKIFSSLTYLAGLSTEIYPNTYLYTIDDVRGEYRFLFRDSD